MSEPSSPLSHSAITAVLRGSGSVFAEEEAQLLCSAFESPDELSLMVKKRASGIPLQLILGWAEFSGLRVQIEPGVFIPRSRSEFLVDQALSICKTNSTVVDLCCGSGALGMALLNALPHIRLYASDNDPVAVRCAQQNIASMGGQVFQGDLFHALPPQIKGSIDIVIANAPYVPTGAITFMPREAREHEPWQTLDGGVDGLEVHRRIASEAEMWLTSGGSLLVETSKDQAILMAAMFALNKLEPDIASSDEYEATVVIGRKL